MATNWPRDLCSAVSVAQTGTMALRIPVPHPLIRRAGKTSDQHITSYSLHSIGNAPKIIQVWFIAEV